MKEPREGDIEREILPKAVDEQVDAELAFHRVQAAPDAVMFTGGDGVGEAGGADGAGGADRLGRCFEPGPGLGVDLDRDGDREPQTGVVATARRLVSPVDGGHAAVPRVAVER